MKLEETKRLRVELDSLIEEEKHKVLATNKCHDLFVLSDEQLARALQEKGFRIETRAIYYHRKLMGVPRMSDRWKQYQKEIKKRKKNNGKDKVQKA